MKKSASKWILAVTALLGIQIGCPAFAASPGNEMIVRRDSSIALCDTSCFPILYTKPNYPVTDLKKVSDLTVSESDLAQIAAPIQKPKRILDYRTHRGYTGWKRMLPTHVKVQYAGGMGFMSAGIGWDYGRKSRWETDVLFGFLPKGWSDRTHATFTLRQNYIPWSIQCCDRIGIEPFTCGIYFNFISGNDYWVREPDRYPGDHYYGFTSRLRTHIYVGQRITYYLKNDSLLRNITFYYELSANDLDVVAKFGNKTLKLSDIVYFSMGIKLQLFSE